MKRLELNLGNAWLRKIAAILVSLYAALGVGAGTLAALLGRSPAILQWLVLAFTVAVFALVAPWLLRVLAPRKIAIGEDGVAVDSSFLPIDEVLWIKVYERRGLLIGRRGDAPLILTFRAPADEYERIARSLSDVLAEVQASRAQELRSLERRGRALRAWRSEVEQLARRAPDFRTIGLSPEQVERVLADSAAPAEQRIGAAIALRARGTGVERVRVAAVATAEPRLRVALEKIADTDEAAADEVDAAIEAALMDEPPPRP